MEQIKTYRALSVHQKVTCIHQRATMVPFYVLLVAAVAAEQCNLQECSVRKHYTEIGCHQFMMESPVVQQDLTAVSYQIGMIARCRCVNATDKAEITCAVNECAELFSGVEPNCFRQYSLNECCSIGSYCNTNATGKQQPLAECQYENKTYKEGQVIYPEEAPCKKCICQSGFN
ncbi:hypothetical protein L9F63_003871, partial [Diploptera punctata]